MRGRGKKRGAVREIGVLERVRRRWRESAMGGWKEGEGKDVDGESGKENKGGVERDKKEQGVKWSKIWL